VVVPRPIAWVTTLNPDGMVNAAPYRYPSKLVNLFRRTTCPIRNQIRSGYGLKTCRLCDVQACLRQGCPVESTYLHGEGQS
jgi:hypothetical protein